MRITAVAVALFLASLSAVGQETNSSEIAAPFGIKFGSTKAELNIGREVKQFWYTLKTVPKPHPDFEIYLVQITPKHGVCFVKAVGREISTSRYGSELRSEFDKIREQVNAAYGESKLTDYLRKGALWDDPDEWTMALKTKERTLMARWGSDDGLLKPGLKTIYLMADATRTLEGKLSLEYYSPHEEACTAEVTDAQKNAF